MNSPGIIKWSNQSGPKPCQVYSKQILQLSTSIYSLNSFQTHKGWVTWLNFTSLLIFVSIWHKCQIYSYLTIHHWVVNALVSFFLSVVQRVLQLWDTYALLKFETPLHLEHKFNEVQEMLVTLAGGSSDWSILHSQSEVAFSRWCLWTILDCRGST